MGNIGKREVLTMSKIKEIGLIVEDNSDFESLSILIKRLTKKDNLKFRKAIGNGCGKLRRKALMYADNLAKKGCNMVIIVHDLDRNSYAELYNELSNKMLESSAKFNFVCIPVEEIEAWFLSDLGAIKTTFNLMRLPRISGAPETITSPKEKIGELVRSNSNNTKLYLNTKHNAKLSESISIERLISKCDSFRKLNDFVMQHRY